MRYMMALAVLLAVAGAASAQEVFYTIEGEGIATVDVAPTYAEFWVSAEYTGATVAEAMTKAQQFEAQLREQINAKQLEPTTVSVGNAAVSDLAAKKIRVAAKIQFPASLFTTPETGPADFSNLCDKIVAAATALQAQVQGPILGIDDSTSVQQTAVQRAMEKAYPTAKAAADLMSGQITAVGKVNILGIVWNDVAGTPAVLPDTRRMTCTARVRVTYLYSSTG